MKKISSLNSVSLKKEKIESDTGILVKVTKSQAQFKRIKNPNGADTGVGTFLLIADIRAKEEVLYIPISIASGKKVTGFMYQIEGTAKGTITTASVTAKGEGVTQITLGTLLYAKIPAGTIATFRIQLEMKGKVGNTYSILINQINYKLQPTDARYKKYSNGVRSRSVEFK